MLKLSINSSNNPFDHQVMEIESHYKQLAHWQCSKVPTVSMVTLNLNVDTQAADCLCTFCRAGRRVQAEPSGACASPLHAAPPSTLSERLAG